MANRRRINEPKSSVHATATGTRFCSAVYTQCSKCNLTEPAVKCNSNSRDATLLSAESTGMKSSLARTTLDLTVVVREDATQGGVIEALAVGKEWVGCNRAS